jgi:3-oxoacyl-[acyl-carrier-protein] synthase-3
MNITIERIEYALPERIEDNEYLGEERPDWDMERVGERAGVFARHIAADDETALDFAERACAKLFEAVPDAKDEIDLLIFCTQSPDYVMPPNAYVLQKRLGLKESIFAYDFNLACSGYIYGLAMAQAFIRSGMRKRALLVTGDTYSKFIHKGDRSARTLFGDGVAATLVGTTDDETVGLLDLEIGSAGADFDKFMIPGGFCRIPSSPKTREETTDKSGNVRTLEDIHMDGMGVLTFINSRAPKQIKKLLKRNDKTLEDVDRYVFHQASKLTLDSLERALKMPEGKSYRNLDRVGNTVSASIPIALKDALDEGAVKRGDLLLLSGFGVGLSWGSILYRM